MKILGLHLQWMATFGLAAVTSLAVTVSMFLAQWVAHDLRDNPVAKAKCYRQRR